MSLTTEVAALLPITTENRKTCGIATNMAWTDGKLTLTWFLKWKRDWLTGDQHAKCSWVCAQDQCSCSSSNTTTWFIWFGFDGQENTGFLFLYFTCCRETVERATGRERDYVSLDGRWQFLVVCLPQPWLRFDTWFGLLTLTMVGRLVGWLVDWLRMRRYDFGLELQGGLSLMFVVAVW